jgi:putative spermidine/putrescine transport system ATP-binding protein
MTSAPFLHVDGVSVTYGKTRILDRLDLGVAKGEFVALLGSSGCGKTTLLRTIAGFSTPTEGALRVDGRDVTRAPPDRRGMALVFQSYALWPHMTVAANIGYGLKLKRQSRTEIATRVDEIQNLLGLNGLGERLPTALSGGQRQRVALGRALAVNPDILLLDEPLSNLDARIRLSVRHEIRALQRRLGITAIHVTHDREEAMVMADRIVILDAGRIAQQGTPEEVYNQPASAFVAAFMGAENLLQLDGQVSGASAAFSHPAAASAFTRQTGEETWRSGAFAARFRAEAAVLCAAGEARPDTHGMEFQGKVTSVSYPGGLWRHAVTIGNDSVLVDAPRCLPEGEAVRVFIPTASLFLFPMSESSSSMASTSRSDGFSAAPGQD